MVFALAACGSEDTTPSENPTEPSSEPTTDAVSYTHLDVYKRQLGDTTASRV